MLHRLKNQAISKVLALFPALSRGWLNSYLPRGPWESGDIPWTAPSKPLCESTVAVVTTAGVHHRWQEPFDMDDPNGDPSFRELDAAKPLSGLMITHDYYDHADADRDINIVFPLERLREFEAEGLIGKVAGVHYGFMGHIDGPHIKRLVTETAPGAASLLKARGVDAVLLVPA